MAGMTLTAAFRAYGAALVNRQWAISSISERGELVISLWDQYLGPHGGKLRYRDALSRWQGNVPGNNLLRTHLERARDEDLPIRLVKARAKDPAAIDRGEDASNVPKTFNVRTDLVGRLVSFDGDEFVIDFDWDR